MSGAATIERSRKEIAHGKRLAAGRPESVWGWEGPAGRMRAARRVAMIASGAHLQPGMKVLEIGCGTGLFTESFAQTGVHLVAVDISSDLLDLARLRRLPDDRVRFIEGRLEDLDLGTCFDAVIGSSILHHLDIEPALQRIHELLKPGGLISFTEPNMLNPQIMLQKNVPWVKRRVGDSPEETAFFRQPLERLLRQVGFVLISIVPFDWLHPSTPVRLIPLVSRIGQVLEELPLVREFAGSLFIRAHKP